MYKIYINETPVYLIESERLDKLEKAGENRLILPYSGNKKQILQLADMLEKSGRYEEVALHFADLQKLFDDFCSKYKIIQAAGGIVRNGDGKILMIYRRGWWDLPKGKIDPGETVEAAAVREVEEETGVRVKLPIKKTGETWHTYREKKHRVLKQVFWFEMEAENKNLKLQSEEDIESGGWYDLATVLHSNWKMYASIKEILQRYSEK